MQLPASIGKYELLEFLGGGMSKVYRAKDTVIGRAVVVKILTENATADPEAKARFLQEARVVANIQHENIVSVFDYGDHEGNPYIVMEYLKGEDLRDAIRGARVGNLHDRIKVALDIASALDYVHGLNIVHRDIKPENIHIDPNGRVKLMDFGIAKTADLSLTKTGMAMGTPYYMAPEQIAGKPITTSVDVYAYGLLLFEILTGVRAVNGEMMEQVFYQILHEPVDVAAMENAGAPPQARDLVVRCTAKKPEDRPQNFRAIVEALRGILAGEPSAKTAAVPITPPVAAPTAKKTSPVIWVVVGVILVSVAAFLLMKSPDEPQEIGMTYIPEGEFLFGENKTTTKLHAYFIDTTEVSAGDFCQAMGCSETGDLPKVNITVAQAREYATKKGKRLPTAQEWERAARGTKGALFPWGDALDPSKANVASAGLAPIRSGVGYPIYHMIGNAWEMIEGNVAPTTDSLTHFPSASANDKWITMRGGSFKEKLDPGFSFDAAFIPESLSDSNIGFRCVKDAK